jgi:hypothetical protein
VPIYAVRSDSSTLFNIISFFIYLLCATATITFEELEAKHFRVLPEIKEKIVYYKVLPLYFRVETTT